MSDENFPTPDDLRTLALVYLSGQPWPDDDWFTIADDKMSVNLWINDATKEKMITVYFEDGEQARTECGISVPMVDPKDAKIKKLLDEMENIYDLAKAYDLHPVLSVIAEISNKAIEDNRVGLETPWTSNVCPHCGKVCEGVSMSYGHSKDCRWIKAFYAGELK